MRETRIIRIAKRQCHIIFRVISTVISSSFDLSFFRDADFEMRQKRSRSRIQECVWKVKRDLIDGNCENCFLFLLHDFLIFFSHRTRWPENKNFIWNLYARSDAIITSRRSNISNIIAPSHHPFSTSVLYLSHFV